MVEAIRALTPDAGWSLIEEDYDTIIWHSTDIAKPNKSVVLAKMAELQLEYDAKEYKELRKKEYPPIEDYLDGIVKGDTQQVQDYIDACLAVKAKYPKPE
jgi:hypothetical protein